MYKVYFETRKGTFHKLGEVRYDTATLALIRDYLKMTHYKSNYYNTYGSKYKGNDSTLIDYGSHTEFFHIVPPIDTLKVFGGKNDTES